MNKIRLGILGYCIILIGALPPQIVLSESSQIIISEVMARGSEVNPDKDDWIELYNPGDEEVVLTNWEIRGVTKGGKWIKITEEPNRAIQPHDFFVISHYTDSRSSALDVSPQINKSSIEIRDDLPLDIEIRNAEGVTADHATYPLTPPPPEGADPNPRLYRSLERVWPIQDGTQETNWSVATQVTNLKSEFQNTFATPKAPNSSWPKPEEPPTPPIIPTAPSIIINEIFPNPKNKDAENEFIELKNSGTVDIDLSGWELDNGNTDDDRSYIFADAGRNYHLNPNEFFVLYSNETNIALGDDGDGVELSDDDGNQVDSYFYAPAAAGQSWGRNPTNQNEWLTLNHPTPGKENIDNNQAPIALIREQGGTQYMSVNLTGEDSSDPDGDALTFLWTFEPGATNEKKNPGEYTYSQEGPKTITLSVKDEFGLETISAHDFEAKPASSRRHREKFVETRDLASIPEGDDPLLANDLIPAVQSHFPKQFLRIKSALPNPAGKDEGKETITLWNPQSEGITIENWCLQTGNAKKICFAADAVIAPQQTFLVDQKQFNFSLKNKEDSLNLLDPAGNSIDTLNWKDAKDDMLIFGQNFLDEGMEAQVLRIIDGDTFQAMWEGRKTDVRLIGVDTPETVHPYQEVQRYGQEASDHLKKLLTDRIVTLKFDETQRDKYGRLLAYVYLDGRLLNADLIEQGFGYAYTRFPFKMKEEFVTLQQKAEEGRMGLWKDAIASETIKTTIALNEQESLPKAPKNEPPPASESPLDLSRTKLRGKEGAGDLKPKKQKAKKTSVAKKTTTQKTKRETVGSSHGSTKKQKPKAAKKNPTISRETIAYQWELPRQAADGTIVAFDAKKQTATIRYTETAEFKIDPRQFNPQVAQQFFEKGQSLGIEYSEGSGEKILMAIKPKPHPIETQNFTSSITKPSFGAALPFYAQFPPELAYGGALVGLLIALFAIRLKRNSRPKKRRKNPKKRAL
ncbi:lamin tail domain-containing protein [Candidatus Peregrinibacteria bacterium]|nr:lamin tail domain-containing protein [Candidatus Peregrinibacteria bacterium]